MRSSVSSQRSNNYNLVRPSSGSSIERRDPNYAKVAKDSKSKNQHQKQYQEFQQPYPIMNPNINPNMIPQYQ